MAVIAEHVPPCRGGMGGDLLDVAADTAGPGDGERDVIGVRDGEVRTSAAHRLGFAVRTSVDLDVRTDGPEEGGVAALGALGAAAPVHGDGDVGSRYLLADTALD